MFTYYINIFIICKNSRRCLQIIQTICIICKICKFTGSPPPHTDQALPVRFQSNRDGAVGVEGDVLSGGVTTNFFFGGGDIFRPDF